MIQAVFYVDSDGRYVGFRVSGHAGYARYNKDIVCASVSILTINTVNAIEKLTDNRFKCEQGESGLIQFKFLSDSDEAGQILLRTLAMGLDGISREYGEKYLQVHYKEV
ncbi:MAG: ribosomal-processing cysteine protease Prp [Wujia sp.]